MKDFRAAQDTLRVWHGDTYGSHSSSDVAKERIKKRLILVADKPLATENKQARHQLPLSFE